MLEVDYKRKFGELTLTQEQDGQQRNYKINIYWCNGLAAFIHEYKKEDGTEMCQLLTFFDNKKHVENLIKDKVKLFIGKLSKISLNMWYEDNQHVLNYFLKMGYRVQCYYKEPKQKKGK